ncbi:MAG: phytoene desaturase family protein [Enterobacteriaceae bacterium PSmelAO3-2]|nr:phytoene desaturase family protein [Enterobacteriaceae bacterium Cmel17]WMC17446.1 MAG: phytoene desaturase family protein [Enterobacteriaceae bacterium Cmel21]WMC17653.1 MAG: phytoene desaturase family protein [Enterobacteriaceae bacterium PSmelAO3-2]WMC17857.1 MAG: phytoene desaturase family protein [Enterobacteriaceae bacterium PSmelAO3-1]WMC18061.1 MAG: phytoene desaturase family protein [Enterobacteriaceae bacterium PSmelAO1]
MEKAIIIGSGIGGIAVAIRLQSKGINTLVIEKQKKPGGCANIYKEKGFTFDTGPTVITDPNSIKEILSIQKNKKYNIKLLPVKPFYKIFWKCGKTFIYNNNQKLLEEQIKKFNFNDIFGYRRFLNYSDRIFTEIYNKYIDKPFLFKSNILNIFSKFKILNILDNIYNKISTYINDNHLRQVFSFHSLLIGGNPFQTSSIYTLIHSLERKWGVWVPKGGMYSLIKAMLKLYKDLGGQIILNTTICNIEVNKNMIKKVYLNNGKFLKTSLIISNSDIINTYKNILNKHYKSKIYGYYLSNKNISNSLFIIYFGIKCNYNKFSHHSIFLGSNYKKIVNNLFNYKNLIKDFSIYLHSPCKTDNSLAPIGCESYYALLPVPNLGISNINWLIEGPKLKYRILKYIEKYYMPNLFKNIIISKFFTPLDFNNVSNNFNGTSFSISPNLLQSALLRIHNKDKILKNLFFVGSGTHPGAGIPGVLNSAKITSEIVIKNLV